jgi:mono/diheme cytochrome c family protein
MSIRFSPRGAAAALALLAALSVTSSARADSATAGISEGFHFSETDGESLYKAVCQACHMAEGQGANTGAGMYPALAANARLASRIYPARNVLHGLRGMPAFKQMMNDEQVAAVTNYVRTHLGNNYKDALTPADVKALR